VVGRRWLWLAQRVIAPASVVTETVQAVRTRARIAAFQQRHRVVQRFPEPVGERVRPRVLAVVTHVAGDSRPVELSVARLERTIDGLLESLGHAHLEIVLSTLADSHVVAGLPEHQRARLTVREHNGDVDPMFVGFEAQGEFVNGADGFDWFVYLEDDIVLGDSLLLEKLQYFNTGAPPEALLIPHRYEFSNGRKFYVDLTASKSDWEASWNRLTALEIGDWKFAECENPHSGFYCLSKEQLQRWLDTGRHWYGLCSYVGPRESAATGCLAEAFRLYKPHPGNPSFLEVRHWDTKYAEIQAKKPRREGSRA
jgi:hypothetical protein